MQNSLLSRVRLLQARRSVLDLVTTLHFIAHISRSLENRQRQTNNKREGGIFNPRRYTFSVGSKKTEKN